MNVRLERGVVERILGRREHAVLTARDREAFALERVLITGAGGTVGTELARQIAACAPEALVLVDQSEYGLFKIEQEIRRNYPHVPLQVVLGDVGRWRIMHRAVDLTSPTVVYHAAAYKHVTMVERALDPAIATNVFGTVFAARAARMVGARFVLISSDKAAQPASVMGATKRLAELAAMAERDGLFRSIAVRFGNILGSSGSLVEVVLDCLQDGVPIPLTDPQATRYFMSAREAVSLVMKADLIGQGGEIFWLDMGEPVRIIDIIERVRDLAVGWGYRPVPIEVIGLRPGEKLREELTTHGLELTPTAHSRIWRARQAEVDVARVRRVLKALREDLKAGDMLAALTDLAAVVPEYEASRRAWQEAAGTTPAASLARSIEERVA